MKISQEKAMRCVRAFSCTALLILLAVCGYLGAKQPVTAAVSVPMAIETISESALSAGTIEETQQKLRQERENVLAQLQSVIDNSAANEATKNDALAQKTELAARMEKEAAVAAILAHMGFGETAVILGEGTATVVAPWQAAENEQSRVKIIDAAATQTGLAPENVKIILSKK